ncbi:MAG: hypothetical protein JNL22_07285 [Bacteroidales bacterium]|nr:hypothetical protein [Bacteroidales bacterium]
MMFAKNVSKPKDVGHGAWGLEHGAWSMGPGAWNFKPGAWSLVAECFSKSLMI